MKYNESILEENGKPMIKTFFSSVTKGKREYREHHHAECELSVFLSGSGTYTVKDKSYEFRAGDVFLFSGDENSSSQYFSGNANMQTDRDETCFTLNIGRKDTSRVVYSSTFCADTTYETEEFLPLVLDVYSKYGNYTTANVGVQCVTSPEGDVACNPIHDRQQAFINSLWIDRQISTD